MLVHFGRQAKKRDTQKTMIFVHLQKGRRNSMRPIDADALEKFLKRLRRELPEESRDFFTRDEMILNFQQCVHMQPTIDAVPVVRCGDCKYGTWLESCQRRRCEYWTCFRNGMVYGRANTVNENDFCSHGEKMEVEP